MRGNDVLLSVLGLNFNDKRAEAVKAMLDSSDERRRLVIQASREKMVPLVYHTLKNAGLLSFLPEAAVEELRQIYLTSSLYYSVFYEDLALALAALANTRTKLLVFKGVALAETVYPLATLRPVADLDILILPPDKAKVAETLLALGYKESQNKQGQAAEMLDCEIGFSGGGSSGRAIVDVHWELPYLGYQKDRQGETNLGWAWRNSLSAKILGSDVTIMAEADQMVNLIAHEVFMHKLENSVRLYCDLGFLISRSKGPDWSHFLERAQFMPGKSYVYKIFYQLKADLGVDVPEGVLEAISAELATEQNIRDFMIVHGQVVHGNLLDRLYESPGLPGKVGALLAYVFPSRSYMRQTYNAARGAGLYLFYLLRPFILAGKALGLAARWIFSIAVGGVRRP